MIVWISRDHDNLGHLDSPYVDIWVNRPGWEEIGIYDGDGGAAMVSCCLVWFTKITGIHLEQGELRQVDLVMRQLTTEPEELHAPDREKPAQP